MTLNAFIKKLQKLQAKGHGKYRMGVDKESLFDGNGSWVICTIEEASAEAIYQSNDDGGIYVNKDGSERIRNTIVLRG